MMTSYDVTPFEQSGIIKNLGYKDYYVFRYN